VSMRARLAALFALALASAAPAAAHQSPYSYVDLRVGEHALDGRVASHVVDLAHELGLAAAESLLSPRGVEARRAALLGVLDARLHLRVDGARPRLEWAAFSVDPARQLVAFEFHVALARPAGTVDLDGPLFAYDATHETYVNLYENGTLRRQDVLDRAHPALRWFSGGRQGLTQVARTFVAAGIHHIFIGPDHILFIVGLLLLGGGLGRLLKIVTAFTVAHSITLALAALEIVRAPSHVIEPAIALSIVVVGVENLLAAGRQRDGRAWIAFGFGFVHGFGFASVLREFGLPPGALGASLFSFNLGVEIGQMGIVLAVVPLLALLRARDARLGEWAVRYGSAVVIAAGSYWFVQRVFFA